MAKTFKWVELIRWVIIFFVAMMRYHGQFGGDTQQVWLNKHVPLNIMHVLWHLASRNLLSHVPHIPFKYNLFLQSPCSSIYVEKFLSYSHDKIICWLCKVKQIRTVDILHDFLKMNFLVYKCSPPALSFSRWSNLF